MVKVVKGKLPRCKVPGCKQVVSFQNLCSFHYLIMRGEQLLHAATEEELDSILGMADQILEDELKITDDPEYSQPAEDSETHESAEEQELTEYFPSEK